MKRVIASIAALAIASTALAGCSSTPATSADDAQQETQQQAEAATRTITDVSGRTVEVPADPQRIVAVNMTAECIALGIKPVGASDGWLRTLSDEDAEGIESLGMATSLNLEKALELEPDLIIAPAQVTDEQTLASLEKIAPTVVGPFFGDSLENLRFIGEVLGRSDQAEEWIAAYEEKAAQTADALAAEVPAGSTALVLSVQSAKEMYLFPTSTWPTVYDVLGLALPDDEGLAGITSGQAISLETLPGYDPDYLFVTGTDDAALPQYLAEIEQSPVWQSLSAVKAGHVYQLGSRMSGSDVLTLEWALDEVKRAVDEA